MRIILILLVVVSTFGDQLVADGGCKEEGCYDVIEAFAELLEKKIKESDAVRLNQLTHFTGTFRENKLRVLIRF